jgi:Fe2+ or Zn2+ uptake regulation protein
VGSKEWEPETIFDVFASQTARQILALASLRPMSAQEFADHCEHSLPTVYRRVNALQEYDLLREDRAVKDDGTQYKTFETTLEQVCFEVEDGSVAVDLQLQHDMVDQFSSFWTDLEDTTDERDDEQ